MSNNCPKTVKKLLKINENQLKNRQIGIKTIENETKTRKKFRKI